MKRLRRQAIPSRSRMVARMMRSRKGVFYILPAVIATVAIGVLLLVIGYQIQKRSAGMNQEKQCALSIFTNSQLAKLRQESKGTLSHAVGFECPRRQLRIELDDVEKYRRIDDDILKTMIAEEVKSCWSKIGQGKLDPFKASTTVDERFCLVCSEIMFEPSLREQAAAENYELTGFQYWMAGHKLPGIKTSLYEYVTGDRPTPEVLNALKATESSSASKFTMEDKYVVVWRVDKYEEGFWEAVGMTVLGVAIGAAIVAGVILFPPAGAAVAAGAATTGTAAVGTAATATTVAAGTAAAGTVATGTSLAIAGGGAVGGAVGLGVQQATEGDVILYQQVHVIPESRLSDMRDFDGDGDEEEFCSVMIN